MKELKTIEEALDFAIGRELDAVDFYNALAKKSTNEKSRDILLGFAEEEAPAEKPAAEKEAKKKKKPKKELPEELKKIQTELRAKVKAGDMTKEECKAAFKKARAEFKAKKGEGKKKKGKKKCRLPSSAHRSLDLCSRRSDPKSQDRPGYDV